MHKSGEEALHSTAHYLLEGLNEIGFEYLFCNLGTDWAPLIEEMARWRRLGRTFPKTILCPHENVAVHMAGGYAMATGHGQGVLVHVDAGTANAAMAMHNLRCARTPVMLLAGKSPYTLRGELPGARDTYVHFLQDPFDQAGIVRPYTKWEYTLPSGIVVKEALRRAHSVMHTDPQGPVYMMLPRETLAELWDEKAIRAFPEERYGRVSAAGADPESIARLAERMLAANNPVIVTAYAGRNPAAPALIDSLALFAGIRVFEFNPVHLNIPHDSPCFGGFSPGDCVGEADLGLLIDVDVPWVPKNARENPASYWAHIDVDAIKQNFPMWGFATNLRIQGDSCRILSQLLEALRQKAAAAFHKTAAGRVEVLRKEQAVRRAKIAKQAADRGGPGCINPQFLCAEIGRAIEPEDIVVNEAISNAPAVFDQIPRSKAGTLISVAGGGLGFSGGVALGIKLARRDATLVQICGDGSYYFSAPESLLSVSRQYELPIFTVVLDNSGWAAVKAATLQNYPEGEAKSSGEYQAALAPGMDFSKVAESAGAYGEQVTDPDAVREAIARCLEQVRAGRSALLHAKVTRL